MTGGAVAASQSPGPGPLLAEERHEKRWQARLAPTGGWTERRDAPRTNGAQGGQSKLLFDERISRAVDPSIAATRPSGQGVVRR
jgi:hypothetical protein